jgi:glycosyltransferase involved in cell wall biosynthesis
MAGQPKKTKVMFLLPTLKATGGTIIVNGYSQRLIATGVDVEIIAIDSNPPPKFWCEDIEFHRVVPLISHKLYMAMFCIPAIFGIFKLLAKRGMGAKVVTVYSPLALILACLRPFLPRLDAYLIIHDSPSQRWTGRISYHLFIPFFMWAFGKSKVASVNSLLHDHIKFLGRASLPVIPNGLDEVFLEPRKANGPSQRKQVLCYIGSPTAAKGWDVLLRESNALAKKIPDMQILCCLSENPPDRDRLPSCMTIYKVAASRQDLADALDRSAFVLNSSPSESFCLPVLEGMARGCIAITTPTLGARSYVREGRNGFYLDPGKEGHLSSLLEELLKLPDQDLNKMSVTARDTALAYNWNKTADELFHFLNVKH